MDVMAFVGGIWLLCRHTEMDKPVLRSNVINDSHSTTSDLHLWQSYLASLCVPAPQAREKHLDQEIRQLALTFMDVISFVGCTGLVDRCSESHKADLRFSRSLLPCLLSCCCVEHNDEPCAWKRRY